MFWPACRYGSDTASATTSASESTDAGRHGDDVAVPAPAVTLCQTHKDKIDLPKTYTTQFVDGEKAQLD
jgi:hypothetical protein